MKKLWIGVLIVAIAVLAAVLMYNPDKSDTIQEDQVPQANSDSGQVVENEDQPTGIDNSQETEDEAETGGPTGVTATELSVHNSKNDCWIAYKGKVYDITEFLPVHPGSSRAIEPYCGTNGEFESAFTDQHGTSKAGMLENRGVFKGNLMQ